MSPSSALPLAFPAAPSRRAARRRRLTVTTALFTVLGLGMGADAALAQDVTISDDRDSAFSTSTIDNGGPANVIIDGASVSVDSGTAATLDSSNSITNNGTIDSNAVSDGVGVHINTGASGNTLTGSLIQNGTIQSGGKESDKNPVTGSTGILIDGDGTFVGDITSDDTSTITVTGDDSYGLSLQSSMVGDITTDVISVSGDRSSAISISGSLDGNLNTTGSISAPGEGGTAVSVNGLMTGSFVNSGTMRSGTGRTSSGNSIIDAVPGVATVQIGGRVEGGLLNDEYYTDTDGNISQTETDDTTPVTGSIGANAGAPAILVSPTGDGDAFVGAYGSTGYAIVNEGSIFTNGQNQGTDASAILVQGATVNGTARNAVLDGGILNRSTGSITSTTVDGDARAIEVGSGGTVPGINNAGDIVATAQLVTSSSGNSPGGNAYGIQVDEGGTMGSIVNSGTIAASAAGADTSAYGIIDRSGTLTSISNSGEIAGVIQSESTGRAVAIDVSANTTGVGISNTGDITGDILYGSGADSFGISGGSVLGDVDFGAGANGMSLSGSGVFTGAIASTGGTLSLSMNGSSKLSYTGADTLALSSLNLSGSSKLYVPATVGHTSVSVSGNAVISGSNNLVPVFTNIVEDQGTVTLISAGSLSVADPDDLIAITDVPYFYTVEGSFVNGTSAGLEIKRKTAAELGLSANEATLYEHSIAALNSDVELATAVGNVGTQEDFLTAYRQMTPAAYGSAVQTSALRNQDLTFGIISNRIDAMRDTLKLRDKRLAHSGFWAQEAGSFYNKTETDTDPGFDGHTISFAVGYDKAVLGLDALGFAFTQGWSVLEKDDVPGKPLNASSSQFDIYGSWASGRFFVHGLAGAAYNGYKSVRKLVIGDFERTATAKWHGYQFSGHLRAGYDIPFGSFILTPSNSISYLNLNQRSYEETGGGGMDLAIDSATFTSVRNSAEVALAYYSALEDDAYFKAQLRGGWIRSLHMDGLDTTGHFVADEDDSFTLTTDPLAKNTMAAGLSLGYVSGASTISVSYDYQDADELTSHAASVIWYMRF